MAKIIYHSRTSILITSQLRTKLTRLYHYLKNKKTCGKYPLVGLYQEFQTVILMVMLAKKILVFGQQIWKFFLHRILTKNYQEVSFIDKVPQLPTYQ